MTEIRASGESWALTGWMDAPPPGSLQLRSAQSQKGADEHGLLGLVRRTRAQGLREAPPSPAGGPAAAAEAEAEQAAQLRLVRRQSTGASHPRSEELDAERAGHHHAGGSAV